MIAHLRGREQALEPFGWTERQAEWIALACLHSGVFTRTQLSAYLRIDRWQALRFVRAMSERRLAADETLEGRKVCRICGRGIYRVLGAEDLRHRRTASDEVLLRRLLSLDYVIEHPDLPWLPTESEKVGAFQALGIERQLLPSRLYRGAAGNTRRYFPLRLPVALEAERAVFVYVEPGPRDRDGAPLLGCRAPRTLGGALGSRPRDRSRGRRPDNGRAGPGGDGARQLGARSPPLRIRPRNRPRDRPDRPGHHQG